TTADPRRSPSTQAIAAHGNNHAAYWRESNGEHTRSTLTAATDGDPNAALRLLAATSHTATSPVTSNIVATVDAQVGTDPIRGAPDSSLTGPPVAIHTTVPTTLSTPQPVAWRNVSTSVAAPAPAYAIQARIAAAATERHHQKARDLRMISN